MINVDQSGRKNLMIQKYEIAYLKGGVQSVKEGGTMKRREFLKTAAAGAAISVSAGGVGPLIRRAYAEQKKEDIGFCKSVKVTCVSETSWFDSPRMLQDIKDGGWGDGLHVSTSPGPRATSGGYSPCYRSGAARRLQAHDSSWTPAGTRIGPIMSSDKSGLDHASQQ